MSEPMASALVVGILVLLLIGLTLYLVVTIRGTKVSPKISLAMFALVIVAASAIWFIARGQMA